MKIASTSKSIVAIAVGLAISAPMAAWATNGMNMEGYGPVALGMGGASMAYDNGSAAVMNNPATIGLMDDGSRLDVALGLLGPDVEASAGAMKVGSSGDAYYMPAVGWIKKQGQIAYGVGMFAQGGMGTEYDGNSFLAAGSGETVRSEVGVGRLIAPISYDVNDQLTVAGSLDFVWAGMDIKMAMSGAQFGDMVSALGGTQSAGTASGTMVTGMVGMIMGGMLNPAGPVNWARFDFSNSSDFTGEAKATGFAGKIGLAYKVNKDVTFGFSYHSKTSLGDLSSSNTTVTMNANVDDNLLAGTWDGGGTGAPAGTYTATTIPVNGKIKVRDFQWPATYGVGVAVQATDKLMLAADVKRIGWAGVMEDFSMTFTADSSQSGLAAGFAGAEMDAVLFQDWDDQTVIQLGGAYQVNDKLTVRAGMNRSSNPIPDSYLNPLFPAIVENHITLGAGYKVDQASDVNFALSRASEISQTGDSGVKSTHSQLSWQVMYSRMF